MINLLKACYSVTLTSRAFQGLCINEFSGLQFDHQSSFDIQTGEQVSEYWKKKIIFLPYSVKTIL